MSESESPSQRRRLSSGSIEPADSGFLNEHVLVLVFKSLKWDVHTLCRASAVNRRLRALAKRLLWRELCAHHAPRMTCALIEGEPHGRVTGGWHAVAKLLFFCGGFLPSRHFLPSRPSPGHFVKSSRFSKTSGRSFLSNRCRGDVLFVTDPCEHPTRGPGAEDENQNQNENVNHDDVGIYRGVFRGFLKSRTRECLIQRQVEFEAGVRCPYCGARVWSMTAARLIPRRSAARRLGSSDDAVEYFVCLNGHLHGACWLVPLSSDEDGNDDDDHDDDDGENDGFEHKSANGVARGHNHRANGRM